MKKIKTMYATVAGVLIMPTLITLMNVYLIENKMKQIYMVAHLLNMMKKTINMNALVVEVLLSFLSQKIKHAENMKK